jgi:polysaccharide deacetylase family protein (PEP-CTERM system associated)
MINALCIDVEPWYLAELVKKYLPEIDEIRKDLIVESISSILDMLDKYETKATFAILGSIAEKYPDLVKHIHACGHEIASHGYSHTTLYELGEREFEQEIKKSIKVLEKITGTKPVTFRAPSFSIDNSTKWAFKILVNNGFKYDASIFPLKTNLYGEPSAPTNIYKPSIENITKHDMNGKIIEFPNTVIKFGMNFPVTGGFYLRTLPIWYQKIVINKINRTRPILLYLHPWETNQMTPVPKEMPWWPRFITYHAIDKSLKRFETLLKTFEFSSIASILEKS